jgi:predicted DNA binding CopG/RHH family protein
MIDYEQELLHDIESGILVDKPLTKDEITKYSKYAKYTKEINSKKQTTIRFSVADLAIIKAKAKEKQINYQNLIQALVHSYAKGEIQLKI